MLEMSRETQRCVGLHLQDSTIGTPGTHQFSEVMLFELLRLQEIGIIESSRDSIEEFLDSVITLMKRTRRICPDIEFISYYEGSNEATTLLGTVGCCSLVESSEALPRISQFSSDIRAEKVSSGKFRLVGAPLGTELSVFNLKGQSLLRKNFDGGLLEIPNVPAVAKVGGNWVKLE